MVQTASGRPLTTISSSSRRVAPECYLVSYNVVRNKQVLHFTNIHFKEYPTERDIC